MAHEIVNITEDYRLNFNWLTFEQLLYGRSIHLIIFANHCCTGRLLDGGLMARVPF
jgi:hypothetical protein